MQHPHWIKEDVHQFAHYFASGISADFHGTNLLEDGSPGVELYLTHEMSNLVSEVPLHEDQFVRFEIYASGPARKSVVSEENILTPEELRRHNKEVDTAILEELQT